MFRIALLTILISSSISLQRVSAQYATDLGINLGLANYLGEIGGGPGLARDWILDLKLNQTRWNPGIFVRHRLDYNFSVNFAFNYARLQAADSLVENPNRFTRNLHFKNDILELSATGEYYFFNAPDVGRTGRYLLDFKSYFFTGIGAFYNNPRAQLDGQWHALRPLKTEGQAKPYKAIQLCVPVGFGFFYTFSRLHRVGWNISWRYTFTDYVDDVGGLYPDPTLLDSDIARRLSNRSAELIDNPKSSELVKFYIENGIRGNNKTNDSYLLTSVNYSYVLRGKSRSFGKRKNYLYGRKRSKSGKARF